MIKGFNAFLLVLPQKAMYSKEKGRRTETANLMQSLRKTSPEYKTSYCINDQAHTISAYTFVILKSATES